MPEISSRIRDLPVYPFVALSQRIHEMKASGLDVIRLDIGNPDLPPPEIVVEALAESASFGHNHGYTGYVGIPEYRQAVARYYERRFGVSLNPDTEVLPLIGSKEGILNLSLAYLDRGDVAFVPDISYPSYYMGAQLAGAKVEWLELNPDEGYLPRFDAIPNQIAKQAKILWINYPNNPTGAIAGMEFYEHAIEFCTQNDILLASDNPYVDVTFGSCRAGSVLQVQDSKDYAVEFISLSKTYNMAGWRLGAAVGGKTILRNLLQIKSNMDSGHFRPMYDAGTAALEKTPQDWLTDRNRVYESRAEKILRDAFVLGLEAEMPKGSLYVWARVIGGNSQSYAEAALATAHVAIAPGEIYGPGGIGYVRLSLSISDERLDEALDRLKTWYSK